MKETAFLLQAALITAWWVGLATSSEFFDAFQYDGIPATAFWAFFGPDIFLIAALSAVRTYWSNESVELVILGAFAYAALYCCNATLLTWSGYLPTGLMVLGLMYNVFLCFNRSAFRNSSTGLSWNAAKTVIQIVCIWSLSLAVVPYVILEAFDSTVTVTLNENSLLGAILFVCFSGLGLTSAYFMVRDGDGTPLPLDQTNTLVVTGPYRFVRNPMAIAGIGQGVSVSILFQSIPVLVYSLLGIPIWHLVVRPIEERDMLNRFGDSYRLYRDRVSCWIPSFRQSRV